MKKAGLGFERKGREDSGPPENYARVYLSESETGWVEILDRTTVRIANIPYEGNYNIDDVVQVGDTAPLRRGPVKILTGPVLMRPFPVRTILAYPTRDIFPKISAALRVVGGKMEGIVAPGPDHPGLISMAAKEESHILRIVKEFDLKQEEGWEPNFLEPL